jgi:hypothetical protein
MSDVIFETEIRKFAFKDCCEMHDLCLFNTILSCENKVPQRYVDGKGINISKAAFEITGYSCCRLNQNIVSSFSLNSVSIILSEINISRPPSYITTAYKEAAAPRLSSTALRCHLILNYPASVHISMLSCDGTE